MRFRVRVLDEALGVVRTQMFEAADESTIRAQLERTGGRALSIRPERTYVPTLNVIGRKSVHLDVGWWCRELRTLLVAGMTVVEALDTLNAQDLGASRASVNKALAEKLAQGQALSSAMDDVGAFPDVLIASVRASERSGSLIEALDDFLHYDAMLSELRKKVISAAIYPAVVMVLGGLISLFLLLFVVPRFSKMYGELKGTVSWSTQLLIWVSSALSEHMLAAVAGLFVVSAALLLAWYRGVFARLARGVAAKIPSLQRQIDEFKLAKLYHSLALMFRGGFALTDALALCDGLRLGGVVGQGVQLARNSLLQGRGVSVTFAEAGLTDEVSRRLLAVGERTGNFDKVLQTIADRHSANFSTFIERTTRLVEPVLLLAVALLVGGIVVMMYMPVFDIASSLR